MKYAERAALAAARNLEILTAADRGETNKELAAKYGLKASTIQQILVGERLRLRINLLPHHRQQRPNDQAMAAESKGRKAVYRNRIAEQYLREATAINDVFMQAALIQRKRVGLRALARFLEEGWIVPGEVGGQFRLTGKGRAGLELATQPKAKRTK